MFENAKTTREQGDIGLTGAIFLLSRKGYIPLLPITDNNAYDLVIDTIDGFKSVQVKTATQRVNTGYVVELKKIRPNRTKNIIKEFDNNEFDYIFVLTDDGDAYLIPSIDINVKYQLTINQSLDKYKI